MTDRLTARPNKIRIWMFVRKFHIQELPSLFRRPSNNLTNRQTDMVIHREVILLIKASSTATAHLSNLKPGTGSGRHCKACGSCSSAPSAGSPSDSGSLLDEKKYWIICLFDKIKKTCRWGWKGDILKIYWRCNSLMTPPVRLLVCWFVRCSISPSLCRSCIVS